MAMKIQSSQQQIAAALVAGTAERADSFDFGGLDRIPKSQIRAVHLLHENFIRSLASRLVAYLRTHVTLSLDSLEQISYGEFLERLETPTCVAYVGLRPFDGSMMIEVSRSLMFEFVELLLGGASGSEMAPKRMMTEIEKNLMQNLLRLVLGEYREAWTTVADIRFEVQSLADEAGLFPMLTHAEAVVAVAIEVRVGPTTGMINIAIPTIFIKRLRDSFDRLQIIQQSGPAEADRLRMASLIKPAPLALDVRLDGGSVSAEDLALLSVGDVLMFNAPSDSPVTVWVNGRPLLVGSIVADDHHLSVSVTGRYSVE
jgi:flagellar motor switch protein FliM